MTSAASDFEPKLVYLAKRNPALSREAFIARWRQHGALGMSLPRWRNIVRYVHCDVLPGSGAAPGLAQQYDGVGIVWHRSVAARAAHLADTRSREAMERDELETFAEPVGSSCVLTRESVVQLPAGAERTAVKLIRFMRTAVRADAEALGARRNEASGELRRRLIAAGAPPRGHVVNVALPPERAAWGLESDCIEELWFDDAATARRAAAALGDDAVGHLQIITVLTNEVILYEG